MSLSARTTTRPFPKLVAATKAASAGVAEAELVAITWAFESESISKTPER